MRQIFRNSAICFLSWWLCTTCAIAMSRGPILLEIKQVEGKPAACLPMNDDQGDQPIQIRMVGVSRPTGPASPDIIYWGLEVPGNAKPVYLKRGECLVYGQSLDGAVVQTQPRTLDVNKTYDFAIIPGGDDGSVYGAGFCVLKQTGGAVRIIQPAKGQDLCPRGN